MADGLMTNVLEQASGESWTLYCGDAVDVLRGVPDESVGLALTSPPYQSLFVYSASERDLDSIEQQTRVVNGKSFFQNGAQWIDSETQSRKGGKTVRVEFASREYFDFLANNSAAAPWLALGRNVQFSLGDTSYEIFE